MMDIQYWCDGGNAYWWEERELMCAPVADTGRIIFEDGGPIDFARIDISAIRYCNHVGNVLRSLSRAHERYTRDGT